MDFSSKQVFRYTMLPGLWPRLRQLIGTGFANFSFLLAYIYSNAGLLPKDHPYLKFVNFGKFGVRHVVAEASRNLTYSWKTSDKVIIFYILFAGVILLAMQFILLVFSLVSFPVFAGTFYQVFNLMDPTGTVMDITRYRQDLAFVVLDRALGVLNFNGTETFFRSCLSVAGTCEDIQGNIIPAPTVPTPFHTALHNLFGFYSMGIAFLSSIMLMYCIIAIVGETVVSGTPFGKRFNRAWFVPRLILFFAMIMPMDLNPFTATSNSGLNAAQFVTLGVAKFGSNMATNAWNRFGETMLASEDTFLGTQGSLIAKPNVPELAQLTQFMYVVRMCMFEEMILNNTKIYPWIVRELSLGALTSGMGGTPLNFLPYDTTTFRNAVEFSRYGTVTIRFGEWNPPDWVDGGIIPGGNDNMSGYVEPTCGELVFKIESHNPYIIGDAGILGIQENYYNMIADYVNTDVYADETTYCMLSAILPYDHDVDCLSTNIATPRTGAATGTKWPTIRAMSEQVQVYDMLNRQRVTGDYIDSAGTIVNNIAGTILGEMRTTYSPYTLPPEIRERGWAGAALWYNKIAEVNGMMLSGLKNIPVPYAYPLIMEKIAQQHKAYDSNYSYTDRYNPLLASGKLADLPNQGDQYKAAALYAAYNFWDVANPSTTPQNKDSGNAVIDAINLILGTNGILDIRDNNGTHPLAMLSALGAGMVNAALDNLLKGGVGKGLGAALSAFFPGGGVLAETAGSFFFKMASIGFVIGFVLYYVLPLMPFIYFFFAFSGWVKSIFEALVAMPLWALAHIKIDGEGLPGPFATNGYFLLLEILIRPTLIIFGFISSISLFAALVDVLHSGFSEFILNASGSNTEKVLTSPATHNIDFMMGPINELFYTVIYTIIVYMIGTSCFKLIDMIPNHIMRWMGVTVSTFHENAGDPAAELQGKMYQSAQLGMSQLETMTGRVTDGVGSLTNQQMIQGFGSKTK